MAQARRNKPKKAPKKVKKARKPLNLPWGLISIILISGIAIGMLLSGTKQDGAGLGSGLKELFTKAPPVEGSDEAITSLIEDKSADKEFAFYDMLKDDEQFMPEDLPESQPSRAQDNREYFLQAASFINEADSKNGKNQARTRWREAVYVFIKKISLTLPR